MARVELAPGVLEDFDRIVNHVALHDADAGPAHIEIILHTFAVLAHSPLIGRPSRGGKRELVIGQRLRGFVALYRHLAPFDAVLVLAIRAQREKGYGRGR